MIDTKVNNEKDKEKANKRKTVYGSCKSKPKKTGASVKAPVARSCGTDEGLSQPEKR